MKVLPIGEARKRLPELVRKVASGHGPIAIGRRGRCEAVLAPAAGLASRIERRPLRGLVEVLGDWSDVEAAERRIHAEIEASLEHSARIIASDARARARIRRGWRR